MQNNFKKIAAWRPSIFTAIILLIIGIVMIIKPEFFTNVFLKVIGILGILYGGYSMLTYFQQGNQSRESLLDFIVGVIIFVIACALFLIPQKAMKFITMAAGLYFIVDGAIKIPSAIKISKLIDNSVIVTAISVLLPIVIGIIFIFLPINIYDNIAWLFGLCLIICSCMDIYSIYHLNKLMEQEK